MHPYVVIVAIVIFIVALVVLRATIRPKPLPKVCKDFAGTTVRGYTISSNGKTASQGSASGSQSIKVLYLSGTNNKFSLIDGTYMVINCSGSGYQQPSESSGASASLQSGAVIANGAADLLTVLSGANDTANHNYQFTKIESS